jgi:hypothetical protein
MRPSHTSVLALVVSLAIAGGLASFLLATPDEGRRPSGSDLGFTRLNEQRVLGDLRNAEEYHRARHREALVSASASRAAGSWLRAVAGSGDAPGSMPRSVTTQQRAMAFVRWADDLPRSAWSASIAKVERAPDEAEGADRYLASGFVDITLASASNRTRPQRVPVQLLLEPIGDAQRAVPARWKLVDAQTDGGAHLVRAYGDPIIARRGTTVDVIASVADRALASRLADDVAVQLPALTRRYRAVAGPSVVAIWVLADGTRSRAVLNRPVPLETTTATEGDLHGAAWVDRSGDIAVDASRMRRLTTAEQLVALRHALTHVATRHVEDSAPALLDEGIAQFEPQRLASSANPLAGVDLAPLVESFGSARSGLAQLLVAKPGQPLDRGAAGTDELAALATVAWIEDVHGHEALVRLLSTIDRGATPERALHDVLRLDARGVEVAVARWSRARETKDTDTPPAEGDAGDATDQEQHQ